MPLADGTNAEKEDPEPTLGWKTKDDLKDVVVYGQKLSPPVNKIRLFLQYHGIGYKFVSGKKKGSSYTKIPVLDVGKRQVNDSYIILKHLVPVLVGEDFNDEWHKKITYELQPSIEIEILGTKEGLASFANKGLGVPRCITCCLAGFVSKKLAARVKAGNPNVRPSIEVGKEFMAEVGEKPFFGGDKPGQVDIAYYGTIFLFEKFGTCSDHLGGVAGLQNWYSRMTTLMPSIE